MASEALLSARDVGIERGYRPLLRDVNFTVGVGELWQLAGANGVGKTSFLKALSGLHTLGVSGAITRSAAMLYQGHAPGLKPSLSPRENLRWHAAGESRPATSVIDTALAHVGLAGYKDQPLFQLSAGQQRRVGLARLWLSKAPLWLLDEPFTAIDIDGGVLLESRILAHVEGGGSVVFTSHQASRFGERLKTLDLSRYAA